MPLIAWRNLFHDKLKLSLALVGIVFSVVLVTLQVGLFIGAMHNCSCIIDRAGCDVWIMKKGTRNLDMADQIPERILFQVIPTPGVAWAEPLIVHFAVWRSDDGRQENIEVVGLRRDTRLDLPWQMAAGERDRILRTGGVIIDQRERMRFGSGGRLLAMGETPEISGHATRVAGFSTGVGTFTTAPYVFTEYKRALDFARMPQGSAKFVVAGASAGVKPEELARRLRQRLPDMDVLTTAEFSAISRDYWLFKTGMGLGVILASALGFIVGVVIVGQTMYSATIERLQEYGTLKALGMGNLGLSRIIVQQALIAGVLGYGIGSLIAWHMGCKLPAFNVPVEVPLWWTAAMFLVTVGMCIVASITSVVRVFRLEPAIVFRG